LSRANKNRRKLHETPNKRILDGTLLITNIIFLTESLHGQDFTEDFTEPVIEKFISIIFIKIIFK